MVYVDIMAVCWLVFVAHWVVSSTRVKKDLRRHGFLWISVSVRLLIAVAVVLLLRLPPVLRVVQRLALAHPAIKAIGAALCVAGVAIAIWARANLGANWSERPAIKKGHELVTSGPYRFVRHPIYFGMLLAMLGTSLISGIPGLLVLVVFGTIAIYRIRVEERLLCNFSQTHIWRTRGAPRR